MRRVLWQAPKAIGDLGLLKVLQSEINHELSRKSSKKDRSSGFGDFAVDWDSTQSQDLVLRRTCESGEEVAVSAVLGEFSDQNEILPLEALMKVGVKKPGLKSILQFDCVATAQAGDGCDIEIQNMNYIPSSDLDYSAYNGPFFRSLDQGLQDELYKYLKARGVDRSFANRLLVYLHEKEQGQYVHWLHKLQAFATPTQ